MERYLGGEEIDRVGADRRPREGGRAGVVLPGDPGVQHHRRRHTRTAGDHHRRLPVASRAPTAGGLHPAGQAPQQPGVRSVRPAPGRGREDDIGPVRRAGSASSGCSPGPSRPTRRCTCPVTSLLYGSTIIGRSARPRWMAGHADHDEDERIGTLSFPLGKQQRPAASVVAGDICAIGRLSRAETGDTLSDKADPLVLKPWTMPEPLLPFAVQPHAKTDEDKLAVGLQRLAAEDPTLRIEQNPETHQIVLWSHGRGARRCGPRRARPPVRRRGGHRRTARAATRNVRRQGKRTRTPCQAVRRPRPVRGVRHRGRAAAGGLGLRVRRQGGRRFRSAPVHPERREGRSRADGEGPTQRGRRRLSRRRHSGDTVRRQGAQRRLVGLRLPDGRIAGVA